MWGGVACTEAKELTDKKRDRLILGRADNNNDNKTNIPIAQKRREKKMGSKSAKNKITPMTV